MIELPSLPLVLYPNRKKMAFFLAICVLFTAGGVWIVHNGDRTGYFVAGFFALGIAIFGISMSRRAAFLRLHAEGFTFSSLYRAHTVRWTDVLEFGVMSIRSKRMVSWNFAPGYLLEHAKSRRMGAVNRAIAGFDAALPDTYGMTALALAELMAALHAQYGPPSGEPDESFSPTFDNGRNA